MFKFENHWYDGQSPTLGGELWHLSLALCALGQVAVPLGFSFHMCKLRGLDQIRAATLA